METRTIIVLLGLLVAAGAFADAYTWTDESGVVHYSDRPQPGAKQIDLAGSKSSRPRPTTAAVPTGDNSADEQAETPTFGYDSIEIASPASEETLWNVEGVVSVSLAITPALRPGHQVRLYFDGTPQTVSGASFQLQEVWRGVHNLQAEVIDETGTLMIRSRPSRFYIQQNTVF